MYILPLLADDEGNDSVFTQVFFATGCLEGEKKVEKITLYM